MPPVVDHLVQAGYHPDNRGSMAKLSAETGIPHETIRTWFGRSGGQKASRPSIDHAVKIAEALGISLDLLITGSEHWKELRNPRVSSLCRKLSALSPADLSTVEALVEHLEVASARDPEARRA